MKSVYDILIGLMFFAGGVMVLLLLGKLIFQPPTLAHDTFMSECLEQYHLTDENFNACWSSCEHKWVVENESILKKK